MTKTYVVSGRGVRFDDELWRVPPDVEIHFYFQCMRPPQLYKTRTILDKLMLAVGMFPDRVALPGELIPLHVCWAHAAEQPPSGVFRRHTGNLALDLAGSSADYPVSLRHVVQELCAGRSRKPTAIHWIVKEDAAVLDPDSLACLTPRRVRGADEGEESNHVPLAPLMA